MGNLYSYQINPYNLAKRKQTCTANDPTAPAAPIMTTHSELLSTFFGTKSIFSPLINPREAV
jgi:hypothetical protein